jgi:hypothetical protein
MKVTPVKPICCAIYTRVSTDQGLDQEFNSLDAQYDASSAYTKSQAHVGWGKPCQSPAMPNGRCRMHGGLSPGAPKGNKNGLKHGRYSAEAIARRRKISELIKSREAGSQLRGQW